MISRLKRASLRLTAIFFAVFAQVSATQELHAGEFSPEARAALDLSHYRVRDPSAGYADIARIIATMHDRSSKIREAAKVDVLSRIPACNQAMDLPVIDFKLRMPAFYAENEAWREAIKPLFAMEDAVSGLAAGYVATGDAHHAQCLLRLLDQWAIRDALSQFHYTSKDRQAWYNIEDMIFAIAMAYANVREFLPSMAEEKARIDEWLNRISHNHIKIRGGADSCCNNHFYRRALHASMVGVLTGDDRLFQFGVSAIYSALHELSPEGGLPRELERGRRAIHYQNYGVLYLIPIAQIIERQGYDAFNLEVAERTLHEAVSYAAELMHDPAKIATHTPLEQELGFMQDRQYYAWAELYLSRFPLPELEALVAPHRPIYNRSAGGPITFYFYGLEPKRTQLNTALQSP